MKMPFFRMIGVVLLIAWIGQKLTDDSVSAVDTETDIEADMKNEEYRRLFSSPETAPPREGGPTNTTVDTPIAEVADESLRPGPAEPILGQSIHLRELRGGERGELRNLEFVFRRGILPRRLFGDATQLISDYQPLYRNSVGYGAATVFLLYQVVSRDSDGDGFLSQADRIDLAVSRPDGSDYTVLAQDLTKPLSIEYFPVENRIRVLFELEGRPAERSYSLPGNSGA